jgi:hypothetical protein
MVEVKSESVFKYKKSSISYEIFEPDNINPFLKQHLFGHTWDQIHQILIISILSSVGCKSGALCGINSQI